MTQHIIDFLILGLVGSFMYTYLAVHARRDPTVSRFLSRFFGDLFSDPSDIHPHHSGSVYNSY